jgi:hypothetical protein
VNLNPMEVVSPHTVRMVRVWRRRTKEIPESVFFFWLVHPCRCCIHYNRLTSGGVLDYAASRWDFYFSHAQLVEVGIERLCYLLRALLRIVMTPLEEISRISPSEQVSSRVLVGVAYLASWALVGSLFGPSFCFLWTRTIHLRRLQVLGSGIQLLKKTHPVVRFPAVLKLNHVFYNRRCIK